MSRNFQWSETVPIQLSCCFTIVQIHLRVFYNFPTEVAWVILKITCLEWCGLLFATTVSEAIFMTFSVTNYNSHIVTFFIFFCSARHKILFF